MEERNKALAVIACLLLMPPSVFAQNAPRAEQELPEEVVVIGSRNLLQLRKQMWQVEQEAYDVFNKFNDEERFDISCSKQESTGTRINSQKQLCQPNFEIEATAQHGRAYFDSVRIFMGSFSAAPANSTAAPTFMDDAPQPYIPAAALIASQQKAWREKMREVAAQQPEFLDAIMRYSEAKTRYEEAVGIRKE